MSTRAMGLVLLAATAQASTPRNIGITTAAQTLVVNTCSAVVQVQTLDYAFSPAAVSSNTVLTPSGSFSFYSDSACTHSISSVTVTAGTSAAWFYFKPTISGTLVMTVSGGGFNAGTQSETSKDAGPCVVPPPPTQCQNNPDAGVGVVDAGVVDSGAPDGGVPPPQPCTDCPYPSSNAWMTEQQEVDWMNSLGFATTITSLHNSYAHAQVYTTDPDPNVNGTTETDDLRNWYRLYKRTNYAAFGTNAQHWRNFYVNTYSHDNGAYDNIEKEHIYLMGLIDWYLDHQSESDTLAAINRIIDFILSNPDVNKPFFETRITARPIECLAYYIDKMGSNAYRLSEVKAELDKLLNYVQSAHNYNGFVAMPKIWDSFNCYNPSAEGIPGGNLASLFPANTTFPSDPQTNKLICADGVSYRRGGWDPGIAPAVGGYQDVMLMHALRVAARVLKSSRWADISSNIGVAWWKQNLITWEYWDTSHTANYIVPYYVVVNAPAISMYVVRAGSQGPLHVTQFAAYHPYKPTRQRLQVQALMRQYGEYTLVQDSEVIGKEPKHYLSATWEQGYFLTQQ